LRALRIPRASLGFLAVRVLIFLIRFFSVSFVSSVVKGFFAQGLAWVRYFKPATV
jgi:hypothetical protein